MASYPDARFGNSLQGIPPYLVDELLAVYFTHVHVSYHFLGLSLTQTERLAFDLQTPLQSPKHLYPTPPCHPRHCFLSGSRPIHLGVRFRTIVQNGRVMSWRSAK